MTYLIEYLGEFEFIFETVLGYVSGDQMGYFEAKKMELKISRLGTFNIDTYFPHSRPDRYLLQMHNFVCSHILPLWRAGYTPADRQNSWGVLHHPCTVPVYKLL